MSVPQRSTWASVLCLPQGNFFINFEAGCTATAECSRHSVSLVSAYLLKLPYLILFYMGVA